MNCRVNRTLLKDLKKVYYSILCETEDDKYCDSCSCCKNKQMCIMVENLIYSIRKHYLNSTRKFLYKIFIRGENENQEDDTI